MRIRLIGDHSDYHCGSAAAMYAIKSEVTRHGEIVEDDNYDLLIVNGEGSMHHNSKACQGKLREISDAIRGGRRAMLINSVWQNNGSDAAEIVAGCETVVLREVLSQQDLKRQGVESTVSIDQSIFAPIEDVDYIDLEGAIAFTDFYSNEFGCFVRANSRWAQSFSFVDMQRMSWSQLVKTLQTASMLVTGRHHAVYAACKARTPFVALRGNSFKIDGLMRTAGVEIPTLQQFTDIRPMLSWPQQNGAAYETLFDWVAEQEPWRL